MANNCQVFTPPYIVELMLDKVGYIDDNIKNKTIFEPSFGDGAFLVAIVKRILNYAKEHNLSNNEIIEMLDNVYGVEIDKQYYEITISKLNELIKPIVYYWPNLKCENTLLYKNKTSFDLCVANPPFLKIHDLDNKTRKIITNNYKFGNGNTDLYVIFFEACINMMNKNGKMCFITPNSFLKNSSQKKLREYFVNNNLIESIIDYGLVNVFDNIATYTAITTFNLNNQNKYIQYTLMKDIKRKEYTRKFDLNKLNEQPWVIPNNQDEKFLKKILKRKIKLEDICDIQYGIATNADKIYTVSTDDIIEYELENDILRPVIKASTLSTDKQIIFPYKWNTVDCQYEIINENLFKNQYPHTYNYLLKHKSLLENRDMDNSIPWYGYSRSQGIQNTNNKKIVLKHIMSPSDTHCYIKEVDKYTLIYSGIYIVVKDEQNYEFVKSILTSEEFFRYLFIIGKNMGCGYKNVNTKVIKNFGTNI